MSGLAAPQNEFSTWLDWCLGNSGGISWSHHVRFVCTQLYRVTAMSKSTIQNWNAKSQIRNPECQGVMRFSNSECKMSRHNAVLQFWMQRRNAVFQFGMQNVKAESIFPSFRMQNVKAQCSFRIRNAKAQCTFPIRNAKCQGAMLMAWLINFHIALTRWNSKWKSFAGRAMGYTFGGNYELTRTLF